MSYRCHIDDDRCQGDVYEGIRVIDRTSMRHRRHPKTNKYQSIKRYIADKLKGLDVTGRACG